MNAASVKRTSLVAGLLAGLTLAMWTAPSVAEVAAKTTAIDTETPKQLKGVGIAEHLDTPLPLDTPLVNSVGRSVKLADYFDGKRPVILTMNYSNCPMLCSLQLNGVFQALQSLDYSMGDQYRMVTISIDPKEPPARARSTRQKYLKIYDRPVSDEGFDILTGEEANIRRVADAAGFGYTFVPETGEFAHAAVTMICTPRGRLSRYLYGVKYEPSQVRLALLEAAEGKIGSTVDQLILFCYHYDPDQGRYSASAVRIMQLGGAATVLVLGSALAIFWRRERRRSKEAPATEQTATSADSPEQSEHAP